MVPISSADSGNQPKQLKSALWAFPPNNLCNGNRSWWLGCDPEPILIDCPPVNETTINFLKSVSLGRQSLIVLTSREAHGRVSELQDALEWPVLVQEQEAYLLPGLLQLKSFSANHETVSGLRLLWTPGPTPGSCVVYAPPPWNVLFCGRLLIPLKSNQLISLRTKSTFHWTRQQKSLKKLRQWLPRDPFPELASGAGANLHRGGKLYKWECWKSP
ncbi:MBL fold metallo-hydrolase [Prochlorococcus sp. MIT 1307]|uniref:MBL fold metallo-hydrolase n=1 Tax=Prochlorococcus sp. MIT 1307 TaxID=3096219 RepID=UPI0039BEF47D